MNKFLKGFDEIVEKDGKVKSQNVFEDLGLIAEAVEAPYQYKKGKFRLSRDDNDILGSPKLKRRMDFFDDPIGDLMMSKR